MQRDEEVAPKCLLRSLVTRKKRDSLENAPESKERERGRRERTVARVVMVGCIITKHCP